MATAGEGASSYGGGGKFRKKPFRRHQTTPYDRPLTAIRNPNTNGWFSKLLDPASKLISASAHMLFSSVFPKRLLPPPEANPEPRDGIQATVRNNFSGALKPAMDQGGNLANSSGENGISELELMLKQKTFTRSEIDHLTELLRSRTVDSPIRDEVKWTETNLSKPLSDLERHEGLASNPVQETRNVRDKFHEIDSTPVVSSRVVEEDVASPAELAKAYMGSRPSKVSPSMLGVRSQTLREDASLLNNTPFSSKSPISSLVPKTAVWGPENGFTTPRSRSRSAIYNMARTPYSRAHPTLTRKGNGVTSNGFNGPLSSQHPWEHDGQSGSKQLALKRRSSVLDDDFGSFGAIRRIRQKSNLSSKGSSRNGVGSSAVQQHASSSTQTLLLLDEAKHNVSKNVERNGDNSIPSTSYSHVPSKSSEMAAKILEHLEKLSPKEKPSGSNLVVARDKSPTQLTPNMLSGKALRSLEDVDSSKILKNAQETDKLAGSCIALFPNARDSTSQKQEKFEEIGTKKISRDSVSPSVNNGTNVKTADSLISKSASQPPIKKRAFKMSAHEDSFELDDDTHSNGFAFTPPAEEREKLVESKKAISTEAIKLDKTLALPEIKTTTESVMNKRTDLETHGGSVVGGENTGFTFVTSPAPSKTSRPVEHVLSTSAGDECVPPKEPVASPPLFSSSSQNVDKVQLFKFSPTPSANEISGLKSAFQSDLKPESGNNLVKVDFVTTEAQPKILESNKGDNKNTQESGDIKGDSRSLPNAASTSASTSAILSFGAPVKNSNLNNGSLSSSPSIFSSTAPVLASSSFSNQIFSTLSPHTPSSSTSTMTPTPTATPTIATTPTTTTAFSVSAAAPSVPASPIFNFGSSSTPLPIVSSGPQTTETTPKAKEVTFDKVTTSPFGGASFATSASTESSIFGFGKSTASAVNNIQSQGSLFGASSASLVTTPVAASSGTGVATTTQSIPNINPFTSGSSGSSPLFGTPNINPFTSGGSLFGTSSPAGANPFGSGPSTTSSETKSVSSTAGPTSSPFGSSWNPNNSSIFGSSINSLSTGFSFEGSSSSSVAATNATPTLFGSSTSASSGPVFSFTSAVAPTSSLPSISQSQPVFGNSSPFGAATANDNDQMNMEDSMAEDPVHASSTPSIPVFGQPPALPAPTTFMYGSTAHLPSHPFQFGGPASQSAAPPQTLSPFQASSSLDFSAGGNFSLGSGGGGGDKSNRRIVRVKNRNRKK